MKTIKIVKSFEDAFISAFETDNARFVSVTMEGHIHIHGIDHTNWPEGKEAVEETAGHYRAAGFFIPAWAVEDKTIEDIPEDIKAINQLIVDFDCTIYPCSECVFHDHTNRFCMLTQIRKQTDAKYPGGLEVDSMEILRVIIWAAIYAAYGLMVSCSVADDEERKETWTK